MSYLRQQVSENDGSAPVDVWLPTPDSVPSQPTETKTKPARTDPPEVLAERVLPRGETVKLPGDGLCEGAAGGEEREREQGVV
ncbi:hypothetical protein C0993_010312 [Termitomyces sp. T159_Od127]|nr:hypothetical protein C0993_010312 [Termitomyces sp. T159_Od127]